MKRPTPERADEPLRWLKANGHDLGPLTGTDTRALLAIAACYRVHLQTGTDGPLLAVAFLLESMQSKCWPLAKAVIPFAGDWSHEDPVWDRVLELGAGRLRLVREGLL